MVAGFGPGVGEEDAYPVQVIAGEHAVHDVDGVAAEQANIGDIFAHHAGEELCHAGFVDLEGEDIDVGFVFGHGAGGGAGAEANFQDGGGGATEPGVDVGGGEALIAGIFAEGGEVLVPDRLFRVGDGAFAGAEGRHPRVEAGGGVALGVVGAFFCGEGLTVGGVVPARVTRGGGGFWASSHLFIVPCLDKNVTFCCGYVIFVVSLRVVRG